MAVLADEASDSYDNAVLLSIIASHRGLIFEDASAGVKLDFVQDAVLKLPAFENFFFKTDAASFIAQRNAMGLTSNRELWKPFLTEDGFNCSAAYGWLNKEDKDTFAYGIISSIWETSDPATLFPLVNELPKINVNTANPKLLLPLLKAARIPEDRAHILEARLSDGPVNENELQRIIGAPVENGIYRTLGVKTAFWRIRLPVNADKTNVGANVDGTDTGVAAGEHGERCFIEGIVAAIPERGSKHIEKYKLIEWSLLKDAI
jgi:hypothetical protein